MKMQPKRILVAFLVIALLFKLLFYNFFLYTYILHLKGEKVFNTNSSLS